MYTKCQIEKALQEYNRRKSITEVIRYLGYPSKAALCRWIEESAVENNLSSGQLPKRKKLSVVNTQTHPQHPTVEIKLEAIKRCFEDGEQVKDVALEIGYSRVSIYIWRRKFEKKGMVGLTPKHDDIPRKKELILQGTKDTGTTPVTVEKLQGQMC